jgi:hypothetical protein
LLEGLVSGSGLTGAGAGGEQGGTEQASGDFDFHDANDVLVANSFVPLTVL